MEIGGRCLPFQSVTAEEHISTQTTDWKRKACKGNNMSKKILNASRAVKEKGQGHRKLPTTMVKSISLQTVQACHNVKRMENIDPITAIREGVKKMQKMPFCSLDAKLLIKNYSIIVHKTCDQSKELVRLCFTLDVEKRKIRLKIHKNRLVGALSAFVPPQVKAGIKALVKAIECIPLSEKANIFATFHTVFNVLTNAEDKTGYIGELQDKHERQQGQLISIGKAASLLPRSHSYQELFRALSALNLKIRLSSIDVCVEIRKHEVLAVVRRKTVVLDADRGLEFQEPTRAVFRRNEIKAAASALEAWVQTSSNDLRLWKCISQVVKYCQEVVSNGKTKLQ